MRFDKYLVPYKWSNDWIESRLDEMVTLMNQSEIPESNLSCKNCAYADQYSKILFSGNSSQKENTQGIGFILRMLNVLKEFLTKKLLKD